jgi:hypothetical protein
MITPPSRLTFLMNWLRSSAFSAGSVRVQKGWRASVVGISDSASSPAPKRRPLPVASARPPATCSAPFTRTRVAGSSGMKSPTWSGANRFAVGTIRSASGAAS